MHWILLLYLVWRLCYISQDPWQNLVCNVIDPDLASRLSSLFHHREEAFLSFFINIFVVNDEFSSLVPWPHHFKSTTTLATVEIVKCNHKFNSNRFFCHLWNSFPVSYFLATYSLQKFKCNIAILMFFYYPFFSLASSFTSLTPTLEF